MSRSRIHDTAIPLSRRCLCSWFMYLLKRPGGRWWLIEIRRIEDSAALTAPTLQSRFKTLSIVIPVYNEKATIQRVISSVMAAPIPLARELIIVDDFSGDGTREILQSLAPPPGATIKVLLHDRNRDRK